MFRKSIKTKLKNSIKGTLRRHIRNKKCVLGPDATGGPEKAEITLVYVVDPGYNINILNANTSISLGLCRGFAGIGVRYQIISAYDVMKKLPEFNNTIIIHSIYSYLYYNQEERNKLRKYTHIVWVNADEKYYIKAYEKFGYKYSGITRNIYDWVEDSQPAFVFTPSPNGALQFFNEWRRRGFKVESIPLACDTTRYFPDPNNGKFKNVKMAFVGGYWEKKAFFLDRYLKPYEDILTVYGYTSWPYEGYRGLLESEDEKFLYYGAVLSPAIDEPHAAVMGDIVERVFKIMGSGGVALPNAVRFYRELFQEDELYVPNKEKDFHKMVKTLLNDLNVNEEYRKKGYEAIISRHTYRHRARQILELLDLIHES